MLGIYQQVIAERRAVVIPLAELAPVLRVPGVEWHVLQRGNALTEWPPTVGRGAGSDDVLRAAAVVRALDLVITPDSFPAHLAGALGVSTWTLLPRDAAELGTLTQDVSPEKILDRIEAPNGERKDA